MNLTTLNAQILLRVRASGTTSPTVSANVTLWLNETLREFYRLRKWWFLRQTDVFTVTPASGQTYTLSKSAIYPVQANSGTISLSIVDDTQAGAFFPATGTTPMGISIPTTTLPVSLWSQIKVWPAPAAGTNYTFTFSYTSPPADLVLPIDSVYLTDQWPLLAIYGTLLTIFNYLQEDGEITKWGVLYNQQLKLIAALDHEMRRASMEMELISPFVPASPVGDVAQPVGGAQ